MEPSSSSPRPRRTFTNFRPRRTEGGVDASHTPARAASHRPERRAGAGSYVPRRASSDARPSRQHTRPIEGGDASRRPYVRKESFAPRKEDGAAAPSGRSIRFVHSEEPRKRVRAQARQRSSTTSPALVQRVATDVRPLDVQPVTDPDLVRNGVVSGAEGLGYPPIYTQYLTSLLILKRHEEYPHLDPLNIQVIKEGESVTFETGIKVKTFPVTHSIPDAMGVMVETKWGNVVFTGDVRLDHKGEEVVGEEKRYWELVGAQKNLILIADSTNCDRPGFSQPEGVVFENLRKYIRDTKGRLGIGTFASQFDRLTSIINSCLEFGRIIVPEGRSIKTNIDIAIKAGLIKVPAGLIVSAPEADKYPRDKVVILATGAQGEEFAAMSRIATGEHKFFKLDQYDTVLLSSSVIPGNELAVQSLKDKIFRNNSRVVTYQGDNIHASGHGYSGEMNWIRRTVGPKFLMPIHGNHFHLKSHMYAAIADGFPRENVVVPDNGSVIEIYKGEMLRVLPEKMPNEDLTVDGLSVGLRQEVVLRDRIALSNDGMFVVVASLDTRTGKLRKSPDIISRGFIYLRENQQLLNDARTMVRTQIEESTANSRHIDLDVLRDEVTDALTKFLLQQTNKTPIVIPVIIGF